MHHYFCIITMYPCFNKYNNSSAFFPIDFIIPFEKAQSASGNTVPQGTLCIHQTLTQSSVSMITSPNGLFSG